MGYVEGLNLNEDGLDAWDGEKYEPVPRGDYVLRVADVEQTTTKSSGKPMLAFKMEVVSDEKGGEAQAGKTIRHWQVLSTNQWSRKRLKNLIQATEVEIDESGNFDSDDFLGKMFVATVEIEEREGTKPDGSPTVYTNNRILRERPYAR